MNHEQSIDDILRLLKESYGGESADNGESFSEPQAVSDSADFSSDHIQSELKKRFISLEEQVSEAPVLTLEEELAPWEESCAEETTEEPTETVMAEETALAEDETDEPEEEIPEDEDVLLHELQDFEVAEALTVEATPNVEFDTRIDVVEPSDSEPVPQAEPMDEDMQGAVMDLLLQLGCEEEWDTSDEEEQSADSSKNEEARQKARSDWYVRAKRLAKRCRIECARTVGLALVAVVLFLYDGISGGLFKGIIDLYRSYPLAYILFGTQLLLVGVLIMAPTLWRGVRHLFKLKIHLVSVTALLTLFVLVYDGVSIFASLSSPPPQFHFLTSLTMLLAQISVWIEARSNLVYWKGSDSHGKGNRFTLVNDPERDPVVKTMLSGGLSYDKTVYSPRILPLDFLPKEVDSQEGEEQPLFVHMTVPTVLISFLAILTAMLLNQKQQTTFATGMILLCFMLPIVALFVPWIVTAVSIHRLKNRDIYFCDGNAVTTLGKADYLVFNDLHLFSKATADHVKMVAYEQEQVGDLLGCLQCLYARIGGPLSDVFGGVPEEFLKKSVRIRRIKRNGMEAIVDRKHVLLVGDATFMQQYGLPFEERESKRGRGVLCASLDGKKTASLMVQYRLEPVFEMLVERLHREKVQCVIETFDPMIQAKFVASARVLGNAPINVVHKGCAQLSEKAYAHHLSEQGKNPSVIVFASRLKLAEAMIWSKRIQRIRKKCAGIGLALSILGLILGSLLLAFGIMADATQYWMLAWAILSAAVLGACVLGDVPTKRELTVEAFEEERMKALQKQREKK